MIRSSPLHPHNATLVLLSAVMIFFFFSDQNELKGFSY